jgi:tRNA threonylcarbamoyladenosine biosynthesis protein TsaB
MLLAINTSTLQFSLAVMTREGTLLAEMVMSSRGGRHFGGLMPALERLIADCEEDIRDVSAVAVATGPGSFTGLRVGLSAAKGLVHALGVPLVGIPSLTAMAGQISGSSLPICPLLDSRRGEVFCATFVLEDGRPAPKMEISSLRLEEFPTVFREQTLFVGNDFRAQGAFLKKTLGAKALLAPPPLWSLRASLVGHLALDRLNSGKSDDPRALEPIYLRPPDIRPNPYCPPVDLPRPQRGAGVLSG